MGIPLIGKKSNFNKIMKMEAEDKRKEVAQLEEESNKLVKRIEDIFYEENVRGKVVTLVLQQLRANHDDRLKSIVEKVGLNDFKREVDLANNEFDITIKKEQQDNDKIKGENPRP